MFKKINFLLLLVMSLAFLLISCDSDETESPKKCSPKCSDYETCNDKQVCELKADRCKSDTDCKTGDKTKCNLENNTCQEEGTITCTDAETKCNENTLLTCSDNSWTSLNCADTNKVCKLENSIASCVEEATHTCTDNKTKCEGDKLLTCTSNEWTTLDCTTDNKVCKTEKEVSFCAEGVLTETSIPEVKALTQVKTVITSGVVTYINTYDNKVAGFYIQESVEDNGAMYVFIKDGVNSSLKLGDTVKVTGQAWASFGVVRIGDNENIPTFEITSTTSTVPTPKDMASDSLTVNQVDMLVNITNMPFTVISFGDAPKYHTLVRAEDGKELIINSKLYRFNENGLTVGSIISNIKGIVGSYQEDDLSFTLLVRPRTADDITFTNIGTEGYACRETAENKCNEGLKCIENICEVRLPCDNACTELQYCDIESDACITLTVDPISEVRALTEDKRVIVEGVITQYKRHNQSTLNIFIQDATTAYAGMNIYVKNTSLPSVSIGQKIRVMGLAHLYQGIIEIGSATDHPVITILDSDIETAPKSITAEEITEENLYLFVELANPPFTVTSIETGIEKYVTFTDNLGNSFLLNNDWVTDNPYFYGPLDPEGADVLTSLKGLVSYRFVNEAPIFTLNPRAESDFEFLIEE